MCFPDRRADAARAAAVGARARVDAVGAAHLQPGGVGPLPGVERVRRRDERAQRARGETFAFFRSRAYALVYRRSMVDERTRDTASVLIGHTAPHHSQAIEEKSPSRTLS